MLLTTNRESPSWLGCLLTGVLTGEYILNLMRSLDHLAKAALFVQDDWVLVEYLHYLCCTQAGNNRIQYVPMN